MRDNLTSSAGSGVYTPFSKNVDKFIEQLKSKNPNNSRAPSQANSRAPSPSMQDWKVIAGNSGTWQGTPHEEMSLLRSDAYRSPSPSVSGHDTTQNLDWQNAKRNPSTNLTQLMCEGCSFCVTVAADEEAALNQLNRRFENRCPMTLFSQMAGIGAGAVTRSDAYSFLQQRGWKSEEITELLDRLDIQGTGDIDREHLVRSYDAVMCEESGNRNIANAIELTFQQRRFAFQYSGSVVQPKDAPSPDRWHEQACCHLGLKGFVRLCRVGLLLEVGISLQGQRDDIRAYVDAFMVSSVSGNTDSMVLPIRRLGKDEVRMAELKVSMHHSSKELHTLHRADLARSNAPVGPPETFMAATEEDDEDIPEPAVLSPHLPPGSVHSTLRAASVHSTSRISPEPEPVQHHTRVIPMRTQEPAQPMGKEEILLPSRGSTPPSSPTKTVTEHSGLRVEGLHHSVRSVSPSVHRVLSTSVSMSADRQTITVTPRRESTPVAAPPATAAVTLAKGSVSPPGRNAAALYDYQGVEEDELSIYTGQVLQVISRHDDGWVLVQNSQGRFGVVPGNYLAMMDKPALNPAVNGSRITAADSSYASAGGTRRVGGVFTEALTAGESAGCDFEAKLRELEGMLSNAGGDLFSQVTACRKTVAVTLAALAESRDKSAVSSPQQQPLRAVTATISPTSTQPRSPAPLAHQTRSASPEAQRPSQLAAPSPQRIEMSKRAGAAERAVEREGPAGVRGMSPSAAAAQYEQQQQQQQQQQRAREGFHNDFDDSSESESSDDSVGWRPRSRLSRLGMRNNTASPPQAPPIHNSHNSNIQHSSSSAAQPPNGSASVSQSRQHASRSRFNRGDVSDESDSDSDSDDVDDRPPVRTSQLLQPSPPDVPKLNLSKVGGSRLTPARLPMSVGGAVAGNAGGGAEKYWRVYVQLIEGRDLAGLVGGVGRGAAPSPFCCLSILQGPRTDGRWHQTVEHEVPGGISGGGLSGGGRVGLRLAPQQTTRPCRHSFAPSWNQGFVFADAYPTGAGEGSTGKMGVGDRESLRGSEVLLLLTVHDAGESPGIGAVLLGRATLQVTVGHPADHWVPVKPRDGAAVGRGNPAVHLRVAYGSSSFGSSPSTAMGPNSGFWA